MNQTTDEYKEPNFHSIMIENENNDYSPNYEKIKQNCADVAEFAPDPKEAAKAIYGLKQRILKWNFFKTQL
jgi:hypothetical protein